MKLKQLKIVFFFICIIAFSFHINYVLAVSDSTSDKFGAISIKEGEYIVQNNVWGADTSQTVTVPDINVCRFNVTESNHNQGGVASYPSIFKGRNNFGLTTSGWQSITISNLASATFNWTVNSTRPTGKYNVAAEAWFSSSIDTSSNYSGGGELMIWLDSQGMVPAGTQIGTYGSYEVWFAQMDHQYICYFQTGQNSVNINLTEFIHDAMSRGYLDPSWYLHDIEAGFEICSGGEGLVVESFSAEVSAISPSSTTTTTSETTTTATTTTTTTKPTSSWNILLLLLSLFALFPLRQRKKKS